MSKQYQYIPMDRKTLFLRNIENYMIMLGILDKSKLKNFRKHSCKHILDMLSLYIIDEKNNSNEYLMRTYTDYSYKLRYQSDLLELSKQ
jgi:hypothetical protein